MLGSRFRSVVAISMGPAPDFYTNSLLLRGPVAWFSTEGAAEGGVHPKAGMGAAWSSEADEEKTSAPEQPSAVPTSQAAVANESVKDGVPGRTSGEAGQPKRKVVVTTAPWPFIDPSRPLVAPKLVSRIAVPLPVEEAIKKVQDNASARRSKKIESVEAVLHVAVDTRRGDQVVRGSMMLPHGTGGTRRLRVGVFADGADAQLARDLGADVVGGDELVAAILASGGKSLPFDRCLTTPAMMRSVTKLGRILGPRGLMPNPKMGTLTTDVAQAMKDMRGGRLEYRTDKGGNLHACVGKVNMPTEQLVENLGAFVASVIGSKPPTLSNVPVEGFLMAAFVKSTTTQSVPVMSRSFLQLASTKAAKDGNGFL